MDPRTHWIGLKPAITLVENRTHHKSNDVSLCSIIGALSVSSSLSLDTETLLDGEEAYDLHLISYTKPRFRYTQVPCAHSYQFLNWYVILLVEFIRIVDTMLRRFQWFWAHLRFNSAGWKFAVRGSISQCSVHKYVNHNLRKNLSILKAHCCNDVILSIRAIEKRFCKIFWEFRTSHLVNRTRCVKA